MIQIPPHCSHSCRRQNRLSKPIYHRGTLIFRSQGSPSKKSIMCTAYDGQRRRPTLHWLSVGGPCFYWWSSEKDPLTLVVSREGLTSQQWSMVGYAYWWIVGKDTLQLVFSWEVLLYIHGYWRSSPYIGCQQWKTQIHCWSLGEGPPYFLWSVENRTLTLVVSRKRPTSH